MLPNCPLNTAAQPFITRPAPLTSSASPGPAPLYIQFQRTTYTSPQMLYHLLRAASQALTSAWKAFPSPAFCPANSLKFKDAQLLCHEPPSWPLPGPTGYTEDRAFLQGTHLWLHHCTVKSECHVLHVIQWKVHPDIKPDPLKDHLFTRTCRNFHVKICNWGRHSP